MHSTGKGGGRRRRGEKESKKVCVAGREGRDEVPVVAVVGNDPPTPTRGGREPEPTPPVREQRNTLGCKKR